MPQSENINEQLVSVIIPCFNYARYLPAAIDSLLNQTYVNWEAIIINDGSTDETEKIASKFSETDSRIKYIHLEHRGPSSARNAGLKTAQGEFIQFLDADDLLEARKLEAQIKFFNEHPGADIVYGNVRYFSDRKPNEHLLSMDGYNREWMPKVSGKGDEILKFLIQSNIMVISSPLLRRRVIEITGVFDDNLRASEDWDIWIRCALNEFSFNYLDLPETKALIRYHQTSYSKNPRLMYSTAIEIHQKHVKKIKNKALLSLSKKRTCHFGFKLALENLRSGNRTTGLYQLILFSFKGLSGRYLIPGLKLFIFGNTQRLEN